MTHAGRLFGPDRAFARPSVGEAPPNENQVVVPLGMVDDLPAPCLVRLGEWPEHPNPSPNDFRRWLADAMTNLRCKPAMVPILWRNHYSGLLLPQTLDADTPALLMDPHAGGRLGYEAAPLEDIRAVLGPHVRLVSALPWQQEAADVFCAVWMTYWFCRMHRAEDEQGGLDAILKFLAAEVSANGKDRTPPAGSV